MGHKAVKTTHNINNAFGSVNANKCTVEWWFKKFCKGDESLEIEEHSGWLSEGDNNQLRAIIKADPLKIHRQLLKNSTSIILCSFGIGNKLKGEILISRCPMNWPKKKKSWFWSTIFFYYAQQQWTISWVDCDVQWKVDFMWQSSMTSSTVGLRRSSKTLPQAKLAPKNGHSHCLVACCPSGLL